MLIPSIILRIALILAMSPSGAVAEPSLRWPLDLETRYLTSNFMEYRVGRFHAGIDLKTRSRSGYPVYAVEDGVISRIRTSTGGYGRALYLRGRSGKTYVYAHLERFADRFTAAVARQQARHGDYSVSLYPPAGRFDVKRGDLLALSGQSGTDGPHLHFEVRAGSGLPVDPQSQGFNVGDTIPPRVLRVRVHPCAVESRIEGESLARSIGGDDPLDGELPPLRLSGPVAFSAWINDASDRRGHRLEPARVRVSLDDSLVFEAHNIGFDFAEAGKMGLEWLVQGDRRERWLMRRPGNDLPGRIGDPWSLDPALMTPGAHRVDLGLEDAAGNASSVNWRIIIDGGASTDPPGWEADPARTYGDENDSWISPFLTGDSSGAIKRWDRKSHYQRVALSDSMIAATASRQGLEAQDFAFKLLSPDFPAPEPCGLFGPGFSEPADRQVAVYRLQSSGDWTYVGPVFDPGSSRPCMLDRPALYALFEDGQRPYLGPGPYEGVVRPGRRESRPGLTMPRWEIVIVRMEDLGAGVDPESIDATLDGLRFIPEPDLPRQRLLVELPDRLQPGAHRLEIRVADFAGNLSDRRYDLDLVE